MPEKPIVTHKDDKLYSSYESGNSWYFGNELIPNESKNSYWPFINGFYQAKYTDENNCGVISDSYFVELEPFTSSPPVDMPGFELILKEDTASIRLGNILTKNDSTFIVAANYYSQNRVKSDVLIEINDKGKIVNETFFEGTQRAVLTKIRLLKNSHIALSRFRQFQIQKDKTIMLSKEFKGIPDEQFVYISDFIESEKGLVFIGNVSGNSNFNQFIMEIDKYGNLLWSRTLNLSWHTTLNSIDLVPGKGYIISGFKTGEGKDFLMLVNYEGIFQWAKMYESLGNCFTKNIVKTTKEGGFILAGSMNGDCGKKDEQDVYLLKTKTNGEILWCKSFGTSNKDEAFDLIITNDGGFAIAGSTFNHFTNDNAYLVKTDENGNLSWSKAYGGNDNDIAFSLTELTDGGFFISGNYDYNYFKSKGYLIKTDANGNTGCKIYIVRTEEKIVNTKASAISPYQKSPAMKGSTVPIKHIDITFSDSTLCNCKYENAPVVTEIDSILYSSITKGNQWFYNNSILGMETNYFLPIRLDGQYFTAIFDSSGCALRSNTISIGIIETGIEELGGLSFSLFPNPSNGCFTLKLKDKTQSVAIKVFDLAGRKAFEKIYLKEDEIKIDISSLQSGVYFLNIISGDHVGRAKLVVN